MGKFFLQIKHFFSNPLVGIIGSIASVLGILLAVYFYIYPNQSRKLVYLVNPAKAEILKSGEVSKLSVSFNSEEINDDITAVQIAFWNAGRVPIRSQHILKPLHVAMGNEIRIIEATIRSVSRDLINVTLNSEDISQGKLDVSWDILEKDDGAVIQIIYLGSPDVSIDVNAVLEGQKEIKSIDQKTYENYDNHMKFWVEIILIIYSPIMALSIWYSINRVRTNIIRTNTIYEEASVKIIMPILLLISIITCIYQILQLLNAKPPIGF